MVLCYSLWPELSSASTSWFSSTYLCSFIYPCVSFLRCTPVGLVAPLSSMIFRDSVHVSLLLNLCKNLGPNSFLLSSRSGSYAPAFNDSTVDVLKVSFYIHKPSQCMQSSFY